jgi:hypothetical protein
VRQRLTETSADQGQPLDIHGRRLIDAYEQLVGILRNRLGQNHAHFFAQPVAGRSGSITWFTPLPGDVVPADALGAEERQRLQDRAERILGDVEGVASDIQSDSAGRLVGDMLRAAAQVAPAAPLFSVGGKPVTVLWGHHSGTSSATAPRATSAVASSAGPSTAMPDRALHTSSEPTVTTRSTVGGHAPASAASIAIGSDVDARKRRVWLLSALIALAALTLVVLGLRSCSVVRNEADPLTGELTAQIAAVEARNRTLETEIARRNKPDAVKCVPDVRSPGAAAPKKPPATQPKLPAAPPA